MLKLRPNDFAAEGWRPESRATSGISGLDAALGGGLPVDRLCAVEGDPGTGKTTLALQFLLAGVQLGQVVLYVTLSETAAELTGVAASHGWSLGGINLLERDSDDSRSPEESDYSVYHPADVELQETIKRIQAEVDRLKPARVVLDSISELKILSETTARYRKEIFGLKQFFTGKQCTVLILDDGGGDGEQQLQSIAHGVIRMKRSTRDYGDSRRQLEIVKMRGVRFRDGMHDFLIRSGGIEVYARVNPLETQPDTLTETITSGLSGLDSLLGGGLDRGTSTLIMGPAGCGKTTLCSQYVLAALDRGEPVSCFLFEESILGFLQRASGMGMDFGRHVASGLLELRQIDPADLSPGEFAHRVCESVEQKHRRIIVIDSLNGYLNAMPSEQFLLIQMHELLMYLGSKGVLTLLVMAQHGMMGASMQAPIDISFLADTVILLRYFEAMGEVRQAISVVKKRRSSHERTIRELRLGSTGIIIGEPLRDFHGVLTGVPTYRGQESPLIKKESSV